MVQTDPKPEKSRSRRGVITGSALLVVLLAIVVGVAIAGSAARGTSGSASGSGTVADAGVTPGIDAGGSPLAVDSAGAPSVAGPTADPSDPAAPVEKAAVPIGATVPVVTGVEVTITGLSAVDGVANGVGEIGGPSIGFTVTVVNNSADPVSLQTAVVGVTYGSELTPADELVSASTALAGDLAPGASAAGTYVFVVPVEARAGVRITLDYRAGTPVAVFEGPAPA